MYIFFMTLIGVIVWLKTGALWAIPLLFVISLVPAGLILFIIVFVPIMYMLS